MTAAARLVIETPLPRGYSRSIISIHHQEAAMFEDIKPFQVPELDHMAQFLAFIAQKFKSGNDIPVERITLTRQEVEELYPELLRY